MNLISTPLKLFKVVKLMNILPYLGYFEGVCHVNAVILALSILKGPTSLIYIYILYI